jgi:hypothetical protein
MGARIEWEDSSMQKGRLAKTRGFLFALGSGIFAAFLTATASAQALGPESPERIVVVGEVQGAATSAVNLLQSVGLIDDQKHWIGGDTILIQTGDLIDGGENVRATLDLFMNLQEEASAAGGRVVVLLGNHEAMNLLGELRDVNYMAYATFAEADSEARQLQAYDEYVAWRGERAQATGGEPPNVTEESKAEWLAVHPVGWVEYVESMSPEGEYGRWLRTLPVAIRIGDVLFIHAGISPAMKGMDVAAINQRAEEEIAKFDEDRALMVAEGLCLPFSSAREMVGVVKEEIEFVNALPANQRTQGNGRIARAIELQDLTEWGSWSILTDQGPLWFRGTTNRMGRTTS